VTVLDGDRPFATSIDGREDMGGTFRRLVRYQIAYADSHGQMRRQQRELLEGGRVVAVIAYDPALGKLVLIRQYRLAAELANAKGQMVEIVAGGIENGEDAADAARREFFEETRLTPYAMTPVYTTMPTPGLTTEIADVFLALVDASALPERAGEDEDEDIEPFTATLEQALAAVDGGAIANGFTLLALNWFARRGMELVERMATKPQAQDAG
jgi:ADP-ribose pyrophosphatase